MASKSSTVTSRSGLGRLVPALLMRMLKGSAWAIVLLHGGEIGDVEDQCIGFLAARADGGCGCFDLGGGAGGERHVRTGIGEGSRGGEAEAAAAAGHERALAVEAEGGGGGDV